MRALAFRMEQPDQVSKLSIEPQEGGSESPESLTVPMHGDLWKTRDDKHLVRIVSEKDGQIEAIYRTRNIHGESDTRYGGLPIFIDTTEFLKQYQLHQRVEQKPVATVHDIRTGRIIDSEPAVSLSEANSGENKNESYRQMLRAFVEEGASLHERVIADYEALGLLLDQVVDSEDKDSVSRECLEVLERANELQQEIIEGTSNEQQNLTEGIITQYQEKIEAFRKLQERLSHLLLEAHVAAGDSDQQPQTQAMGKPPAKINLRERRRKKAETVVIGADNAAAAGGSGGGNGGEGDAEKKARLFREALDSIKQRIGKEIEAIDAPAAYATYRQEKLEHKKGDGVAHYLIDFKEIETRLGRPLEDEEREKEVQSKDEELRGKCTEKFFDIQRADLAAQSERWRNQLYQTKEIDTAQQLSDEWSKEDAVSQAWRDVWDKLDGLEKKIIAQNYTKRFDQVKKELLGKRTLLIFQPEFPEAVECYNRALQRQWEQFLQTVFPIIGLTDDQKVDLWKKKVLPRIEEVLAGDILKWKSTLSINEAAALVQFMNNGITAAIKAKRNKA